MGRLRLEQLEPRDAPALAVPGYFGDTYEAEQAMTPPPQPAPGYFGVAYDAQQAQAAAVPPVLSVPGYQSQMVAMGDVWSYSWLPIWSK